MAKRKVGRPSHQPTEETRGKVCALATFGVPRPEIAEYIGINEDTLRKHYADDMAKASIDRNAKVAGFLYRAASGAAIEDGAGFADCIRSAMFWAKTRMGWKETSALEHTGANGTPLNIRVEYED